MRVPLNREEAKGNSAGTVFLSLIRRGAKFSSRPGNDGRYESISSNRPRPCRGHEKNVRLDYKNKECMGVFKDGEEQLLNFTLEMKR